MSLELRKFSELTINFDKERIPLSSSERESKKGKYPYYGAQGIIDHVDEYIFDGEYLLIAEDGENLNSRSQPIANVVLGKFWVNNHAHIVKTNSKCEIHYLCYLLNNTNISGYITGSAQPKLNQYNLNNMVLEIQDYETQYKISIILKRINDKIKLNEKINKNLQEQIETIYNSFFVYYDDFLKEELEECEIGFIPKDWNLMTLGQITTQIKEKVGKNNYKVFSAVNTGNLILSEEYFDKQVFSKSIEKYIVVKQDEFAYNPARINIGSIGRNDFDYEGCVSPVYVAFKVEEGYENFMNMFIKSKRFNQWVITLSSGSVRQTLNYNDFSIIKIAYPPKSLVNKFNVIYESYYEVINYNKSVIHNLEEIRDTLLPKLMSGEIDVSKINCDLE